MKARSVQGSSSHAVRAVMSAGASQFTGNYLNRSWTRRFIIGSLLQRYNPNMASVQHNGVADSPGPSQKGSSIPEAEVEFAVLNTQRRLCERWQLPAKPLDSTSETRILRLLARNACGEGLLSDEAVTELESAVRLLPDAPLPLHDPQNMERLLHMMGYAVPGDNLRRLAYVGALHYSPQAEAFMQPFLQESLARDGGDVFDTIRHFHAGPGYAIDSATTSEVDDAIGVEVDPDTGEPHFIVYVSDATVYCPFDSQLEQATARALVTTTYLPEGVYFMLPKPIVEAATLREDRPCRTFCIRFQIDDKTAELKNYSVHVGWLDKLRRITYDQVQELLNKAKAKDEAAEASTTTTTTTPLEVTPSFPPPDWLTHTDAVALKEIYRAAQLRFQARMQRALAHNKAAISGSLPDPLIKVVDRTVTTLTDQIISTQDARLAVAELMIAANEVCSRVAQAERLPIPYRGTRPLSSDHEAAKQFHEPEGVLVVDSLDSRHTFVAQGMQNAIKELSGVTRAMYSHLPMYHAGLDTNFYTHSTSPLRRYADMLVHHQLKGWLWRTRGQGAVTASKSRKPGKSTRALSAVSLFPGLPVPEYVMATLCANISTRQEQAALLQDGSTRFWTLTFIQQQVRQASAEAMARGGPHATEKRYMCLVGETKDITAAPEYSWHGEDSSPSRSSAFPSSPSRMTSAVFALLNSADKARVAAREPTAPPPPHPHTSTATRGRPRFVSELYIPELQFAHRVFHSRRDVVVGAVVECRVVRVQPTQDVLELAVVGVHPGGDERLLEKLWLSGVVSRLDS